MIRHLRTTAPDLPVVPKTVELEQRLSRIEICYQHLQDFQAASRQREAALQAQIDYLVARLDL